MYSNIKNFPQNLEEAINQVKKSKLKSIPRPIKNVVIAGMGSSGMVGHLIKNWVLDKLQVPLSIHQDYGLPAYVNEYTLLIVISYSGNTQETIDAFETGLKRHANIILLTSGGKLQKMAYEHNIDILPITKYIPPRACIHHTLVETLFVLYFYGLLAWEFLPELQAAIQLITDNQPKIQKQAEEVAAQIVDSIPIIYAAIPYEAVALRLRQQLNENSKQLCWHHSIPEINHNEIVGWESDYKKLSVIMLAGPIEDLRLTKQQNITQEIIRKHSINPIVLNGQGETQLIASLYLIHLVDWISFYLAQKKGVDPIEVKSIDQIKSALYTNN